MTGANSPATCNASPTKPSRESIDPASTAKLETLSRTVSLGRREGKAMDERGLLEDYVSGGKLMQLSTIAEDGSPRVCSVWYLPRFGPDTLHFISRTDREHSRNISRNPAVAGAIIDIPIVELGQVARGVSFTGVARELPGVGIEELAKDFAARWPNATGVLRAMPNAASRLYEIAVTEWVLFDEENFRPSPRRIIKGL
ncbi:pyridoxamine 5'-phosphate oxidase family protein [Nocardia sp. NPDC052001]|uniref:pyridoxamine 5'-phosphate oxidase family protein n=1 Tax=Nocardia sp. NPDC052001 TaxID=3154853 RepID=UPI00343CA2B1